MQKIKIIEPQKYFPDLKEIPDPPKELNMLGTLENTKDCVFLTIVGSRKYSDYGKWACEHLIKGLQGYPIVIVSGLAMGIDSIAHKAALDNGLTTIAFPGSGLYKDSIYPRQNYYLAEEIVRRGGALLSEYPNDAKARRHFFPQRNRLEAGISKMTLVIEAQKASGTLITARLATEYNKIVGTVPANINSENASGANWLISMGAIPITSSDDILKELSFNIDTPKISNIPLDPNEKHLLSLLLSPQNKDELLINSKLNITDFTITLSSLEIKGLIRETLGLIEKI